MKCLCGYEISDKDQHKEIRPLDDDFDENIPKKFHRSKSPVTFANRYGLYMNDGSDEKYLYACPKCGTIKIDLMEW